MISVPNSQEHERPKVVDNYISDNISVPTKFPEAQEKYSYIASTVYTASAILAKTLEAKEAKWWYDHDDFDPLYESLNKAINDLRSYKHELQERKSLKGDETTRLTTLMGDLENLIVTAEQLETKYRSENIYPGQANMPMTQKWRAHFVNIDAGKARNELEHVLMLLNDTPKESKIYKARAAMMDIAYRNNRVSDLFSKMAAEKIFWPAIISTNSWVSPFQRMMKDLSSRGLDGLIPIWGWLNLSEEHLKVKLNQKQIKKILEFIGESELLRDRVFSIVLPKELVEGETPYQGLTFFNELEKITSLAILDLSWQNIVGVPRKLPSSIEVVKLPQSVRATEENLRPFLDYPNLRCLEIGPFSEHERNHSAYNTLLWKQKLKRLVIGEENIKN